MFERHRPALRRQAARLLYASGHDPDDVVQDAFLRVHVALRGGVVPLEPRAWLMRLVHNACVDELRRSRTRPVGDVELDVLPSHAVGLPDGLAQRAEARALLGDIHRLPERQRRVLVLSAIEGLSHEQVASRLETTVETTRSLLARARENLRRTAAARETACQLVCDALDEAAAAGVRASEVARRHLWTCADCRAYQRDLRGTPGRLRRLAGWSPWGIVAQLLGGGAAVQKVAVGACCALVVGGGAVAVPELRVHSQRGPQLVSVEPVMPKKPKQRRERRERARLASTPVPAVATAVAHVATPAPTAVEPAAPKPRRAKAPARVTRLDRDERQRLNRALRAFMRKHPTGAEQREMTKLLVTYRNGKHQIVLKRIQRKAFTPAAGSGPPKGIATPPPEQTPVPTPTPEPTVVETPTPTPAPVEPTPTPVL